MVENAQGYAMTSDEAGTIIDHIKGLDEEQIKDYYKQPFEKYAQIQKKYTNVGFGDMHHSADFVECEIGRATSELQSRPHLVCRLLLEKKKSNPTGEWYLG